MDPGSGIRIWKDVPDSADHYKRYQSGSGNMRSDIEKKKASDDIRGHCFDPDCGILCDKILYPICVGADGTAGAVSGRYKKM